MHTKVGTNMHTLDMHTICVYTHYSHFDVETNVNEQTAHSAV